MPEYSIEEIDASQWGEKIDRVFKSAYRTEAELLGVESFPPLDRSKEDLVVCGNRFIGFLSANDLCGAVELESCDVSGNGQVTITSLAVAPTHFRKGIGRALSQYVLDNTDGCIHVTTGAENKPAIQLYSALGFVLVRRFKTPNGIAMVDFLSD